VSPDVAAFPLSDGAVGEHLDAGTLLDRAAAFVRSLGAGDSHFTIGHALGAGISSVFAPRAGTSLSGAVSKHMSGLSAR